MTRSLPAAAPEPDPGAMKTKVRRLYDICNVLTSLRMINKVRLPDTSKPAFKWHGVTKETEVVFDPAAAAVREAQASVQWQLSSSTVAAAS